MTPSPIERAEAVARELLKERLCEWFGRWDQFGECDGGCNCKVEHAAITAALLVAEIAGMRRVADHADYLTRTSFGRIIDELSKQAKEIAP